MEDIIQYVRAIEEEIDFICLTYIEKTKRDSDEVRESLLGLLSVLEARYEIWCEIKNPFMADKFALDTFPVFQRLRMFVTRLKSYR